MEFITNPKTARPRRSYRGVFLTVIAVIVLIVVIYSYFKYFMTYSDGSRYGLLQKFSHKGNLFKTYEGELILNSITSNSNATLASEKFYFSVTDKGTAEKLMHAQGSLVTLYYNEKHGTLPWRGDTRYMIDSVEIDSTDHNNRR